MSIYAVSTSKEIKTGKLFKHKIKNTQRGIKNKIYFHLNTSQNAVTNR